MKRAFLEFLIDRGTISPRVLDDLRERLGEPGPPIGAIAARNGLLRQEDIDAILARQKQRRQPFGEIAIELGLLSTDQVQDILFVQRVERVSAVAEALVVVGLCRRDEMLRHMVDFLPSTAAPALIAREQVWSILTNTTD